jgi:hypothetical protein
LACQKDIHSKSLLFSQAIQAIQYIHSKQGYLSEAFARNILVDQNNRLVLLILKLTRMKS